MGRDALGDEVGDASGDHAGFAGTGARDDQEGPIDVHDCLPLGIGQIGKELFSSDHAGILARGRGT